MGLQTFSAKLSVTAPTWPSAVAECSTVSVNYATTGKAQSPTVERRARRTTGDWWRSGAQFSFKARISARSDNLAVAHTCTRKVSTAVEHLWPDFSVDTESSKPCAWRNFNYFIFNTSVGNLIFWCHKNAAVSRLPKRTKVDQGRRRRRNDHWHVN